MNIEKEFQILLKLIMQHQNGKAAESMAKLGVKYKLNFGVSLTDLKKIAAKTTVNHELALKLWNEDMREAKLLSILLEEPEKVEYPQLDQMLKGMENEELIDFATMNLFHKVSACRDKCPEWCQHTESHVRYAGFMLLMRFSIRDKDQNSGYYLKFYPIFEITAADENYQVRKAVSKAMRQIGSSNPELKPGILKIAEEMNQSDEINVKQVGYDVIDDLAM